MRRKNTWEDIFSEEEVKKGRSNNKKIKKQKKNKANKGIIILIICVVIIAILIAILYLNKNNFFKKILDKTPPELTVQDVTCFCNEEVKPEDFVVSVEDDNETIISFLSLPDTSSAGDQIVTIVAKDIAENTAMKEAKLTIIKDDTPPEIWCDPNLKVSKGSKVKYKSFLAVRDDYDSEPTIEVDSSDVNLEETGYYKLKYTVTDRAGNVATIEVEIEVVDIKSEDISDEELNALIDKVIEKIITPDMDKVEQVWAVYEFMRNIPYASEEHTFDPRYEGYKILHDNKGDCYGTYAASALIFDRLGIKNIPIKTDPYGGQHYWNMISLDDGKTWYHYDSTQWPEWRPRPVTCLLSDEDLEEISVIHGGTFHRDVSKYPATPEDSIPVPDSVEERYGQDY